MLKVQDYFQTMWKKNTLYVEFGYFAFKFSVEHCSSNYQCIYIEEDYERLELVRMIGKHCFWSLGNNIPLPHLFSQLTKEGSILDFLYDQYHYQLCVVTGLQSQHLGGRNRMIRVQGHPWLHVVFKASLGYLHDTLSLKNIELYSFNIIEYCNLFLFLPKLQFDSCGLEGSIFVPSIREQSRKDLER